MTTTFAVTGYQRPRLKHYRPSYQSDLEPIYEDPAAFNCRQARNKAANKSVPNFMQNGGYAHDYEEINDVAQNRPVANPSRTSTAMLNGMMNLRCSRPRINRKTTNTKTQDEKPHPQSESAMTTTVCILDSNSAPVTDLQCKTQQNLEHNNNLVNGLNTALRLAADEKSEKQNELPLLDIENGDVELCTISRQSSLYKGAVAPRKSDADVVLGENGFAVKSWPKLEPKPAAHKHFLCPAEKKMRNRCFGACFVLIMALIGVFVLGIIEGWMYTKTGTGLDGTKEPMFTFKSTPGFNLTDTEA